MFTWDAYEAPSLDPKFICHHLNVNPSVTPKKQPPQRPSNEHVEAVKSKVIKLKQAGAIKGILPSMVGEYCGGQEEDKKMACVCELYRSQQDLS